jgi:hypothetical protein
MLTGKGSIRENCRSQVVVRLSNVPRETTTRYLGQHSQATNRECDNLRQILSHFCLE